MRRLLNATLMTLACGAVGCGSSGRNQAAVADGPDDAREDVAEDVAEDAGTSGAAAVDADLEEAAPDADDPDAVLSPDQWSVLQGLSPDPLPASPPDATNGFADSPAAAALGQRFFYDPSFSGPLLDTDNDGSLDTLGTAGQTGRVACAGCHIPTSGFSDTRSFQRQISLGAGWGRRRAWSLLDVGQAKLLMWDGRRDALYNQIFGPLETVVEMNSSRLYAAEQIFARYQADYEAVFGPMPPLDDASQFPVLSAQLTGCQPQNPAAPQPVCDGTYHGMPGDHAEFDGMTASNQLAVTTVVVNAGKAIGAFERLLTCGPSPFDAWMHGSTTAVSRSAQRGAALFVGKADCVQCHAGPFMSDEQFHNVGLEPQIVQQAFIDSNDQGAASGIAEAIADPLNSLGVFSDGGDGRLPAMVVPQMVGAFRTPTLRCVSMRPTWMHTGQMGSLAAVVAFFNSGGNHSGYPGTSEIHPLGLTDLDQRDLVAFMQALDGPGPDPSYLQSP
ncbi:MAG: cytochrome c peroxidase [Polyangiaceae bacterium]|jgi:cytochrome c peroxidase